MLVGEKCLPTKKYKIYNLSILFRFDLENILKTEISEFGLEFNESGYVRIQGQYLYYPIKICQLDLEKFMKKLKFIPLFKYNKNINFLPSDIQKTKDFVLEYLELSSIKETTDEYIKKYLNKYEIEYKEDGGIIEIEKLNVIITKYDPSTLPTKYNKYNIIYPKRRELKNSSIVEDFIEIIGYFIKIDREIIRNNTEQHLAIYKNNKFIDFLS